MRRPPQNQQQRAQKRTRQHTPQSTRANATRSIVLVPFLGPCLRLLRRRRTYGNGLSPSVAATLLRSAELVVVLALLP